MASSSPLTGQARIAASRPSLADRVRGEQAALLHATPARFAGHMINATLVAGVLWGSLADLLILAWLGAVGLIAFARYLMARAYLRAAPPPEEAGRWITLFMIGSSIAAAAWGAGALLVWESPDVAHPVFVAFVIAGTCAVAVALSHAHLPTTYLFLALAASPLAIKFMADGTFMSLAMGIMTILFALLLASQARAANTMLIQAITLREDNRALAARLAESHATLERRVQERTADLDRANVSLHQEIAAHRETESRLRQAHKMEAVGQLTGGIAHDFNNLLAVVQGNAELIRDLPEARSMQAEIAAILRAADRGARLTARLLAFSRRQALFPEAVDLNDLIGSMLVILERTLGGQIAVRFAPVQDLPLVRIDRNQMENALLNLAINARDAMPGGGVLTLKACRDRFGGAGLSADDGEEPSLAGPCVRLEVSDTGSGIAPEHLDKVWDPFFTTKDVGAGTGLGLSMVYGFIRQSGGLASIESALGRGTCIRLFLPLAAAASDVPSADPSPSPRPAPLKIEPGVARPVLVIEDDPEIRIMAARLLEGMGFRVFLAGDGETARHRIEAHGLPSAVVSDISLGSGPSGPDLVEALAAEFGPLRVVFISGHATETLRTRAQAVALGHPSPPGGWPVLAKPFTCDALEAALHRVLSPAPG